MENENSFFSSVSESIADELTIDLKNLASTQGWPDHLIDVMSIRVSSGKVDVHYPESLSDDIEKLEYGHGDKPPLPVVRQFKRHLEKKATEILHREIDSDPLGALLAL